MEDARSRLILKHAKKLATGKNLSNSESNEQDGSNVWEAVVKKENTDQSLEVTTIEGEAKEETYSKAKTLPPIRTLPTPTRGSWFNFKPETAKALPPIRTLPTPTRSSWEMFNFKPEIGSTVLIAKTLPPIRTLPTPTRGSWEMFNFKPEIGSTVLIELPKNPKLTDHPFNPLHVGILGGVLIVAFFWAIVMGIVLRNKVQSRKQRIKAEQPPSYLDLHHTSNSVPFSSDFSNMEPSPRLSEPTEPISLDIEKPVENSPSFTLYQQSVPNVTTQNSTNEEPPSYVESQLQNSNMMRSSWSQPPSYLEAQQQNTYLQ